MKALRNNIKLISKPDWQLVNTAAGTFLDTFFTVQTRSRKFIEVKMNLSKFLIRLSVVCYQEILYDNYFVLLEEDLLIQISSSLLPRGFQSLMMKSRLRTSFFKVVIC